LDLGKYRSLFLEEAAEHLSEMSRALLTLEKEPSSVEAIDVVFRMAHSIKGMALSLGYDSISEVAHRLEDRMEASRALQRVDGSEGIALLFRGLEGLERMVAVVSETGEPPPPEPELVASLSAPPRQVCETQPPGTEAEVGGSKKKVFSEV
jgi:two-component system chemotaxis sensor kinase CheA